MSCITEILKVKGAKEYLVANDIVIESGGTYKGYEYLITFNDLGHRCAYVAIPEDHKLYNEFKEKSYYNGFYVHGGITFAETGKHVIDRILNGHHCNDLWLGFDAAHGGDAKDFVTAKKYFPPDEIGYSICELEKMCMEGTYYQEKTAIIRTNKYMEYECKSLIEQIIKRTAWIHVAKKHLEKY